MTSANEHAALAAEQPELTHREVLVVIGALMLGMFLAALDQTIVSTALPTIVGQLGGLTQLSWVVTAYMLAATVVTPLYGKLGDLYGRKRVFQTAIVIFLVGSVLSGLAQSMGQLIAFRAIQGAGGGGLMVTAQAAIADVVSPRERGRYQGYFGALFGVSSIAGPLLGGFLTDHISWRWVFYINLPIGIGALVATAIALKTPVRRVEHRIDFAGTALLAAAITCAVLVTTWGGRAMPWSSPSLLALAGAGIAMLVAFVFVERKASEPVLPLELFRDRTFDIATLTSFFIGFGMFGVISFVPLFLQVVDGASATSSGFALVPLMAGALSASIVSGQLITRTGRYKVFPVVGTAVGSIGMFLLSRLEVGTSRAVSTLDMVLVGLGIGLVMQVMIVAVQNSVERKHLGVATSTVTFFRSVGGSFGVAVFGAIFNARLAAEIGANDALAAAMGPGGPRGVRGALEQLPAALRADYVERFARALTTTFAYAVPCLLVAFVCVLRLQEKPLRGRAPPKADAG